VIISRKQRVLLVLGGGAFTAFTFFAKGGLFPYLTSGRKWAIAIYEGPTPFDLSPAAGVPVPALRASDVTDVPARFVADPFLLPQDGRWFLFCEVFRFDTRQGDIGLATSPDGRRFTYERIVLDEPFHLSYPYVFEAGGAVYMVPESGTDQTVRLYRAAPFPTKWVHVRTLLRGAPYVDTSLAVHGDRVWLFTSLPSNDTLLLFSAPTLEGPFEEHPMSPIVRGDRRHARPGGRAFTWEGRLYRLAQDDTPSYGSAVRAFEITELTSTTYRERAVRETPILSGSGRGWNARGMHTLDPHPAGAGRWLAAVDGYRKGLLAGWR